jgi:hypothetical protein
VGGTHHACFHAPSPARTMRPMLLRRPELRTLLQRLFLSAKLVIAGAR